MNQSSILFNNVYSYVYEVYQTHIFCNKPHYTLANKKFGNYNETNETD